MKLLFCANCGDIFNLSYDEKHCSCGVTSGTIQIDGTAVYHGDAVPLGFCDPEFDNAILNKPKTGKAIEFLAFVIPENAETFVKQ